jgi:hypothetical protein
MMAFTILSGKGWKAWSTDSTSYSWTLNGIQTLGAFYAKYIEKKPIWLL